MKKKPSSIACSIGPRKGEIMDTLVFMLVAILLPAWILGTLYLSFFPTTARSAGMSGSSDSQWMASADGTPDVPLTGDPTLDTDHPIDTDLSVDGSRTKAVSDSDLSPSDHKNELTADSAAAWEEKINGLKQQLQTKSQELEQLRQTSMASQSDGTSSNVDTSAFENQITQLTQQRDQLSNQRDTLAEKVKRLEQNADDDGAMSDQVSQLTAQRDRLAQQLASVEDTTGKIEQLDQKIMSLNKQTQSQQTRIDALQEQLAAAETARQAAEQKLANAMTSTAADDSPTLAGSAPREGPLEFREWTSSRGSKARLAFVRWEGNRVIVVNESKKEFRLPLDRLSPNDQNYVNNKR